MMSLICYLAVFESNHEVSKVPTHSSYNPWLGKIWAKPKLENVHIWPNHGCSFSRVAIIWTSHRTQEHNATVISWRFMNEKFRKCRMSFVPTIHKLCDPQKTSVLPAALFLFNLGDQSFLNENHFSVSQKRKEHLLSH